MGDTEQYEAHCHCGSVKITLEKRPEFINDCNCSLCSKSGSIWGYFSWSNVEISGSTHTYTRSDRSLPAVQVHFCSLCGSTTHWSLTEAYIEKLGHVDRMGVNMRLFDGDQLSGVEVRFPDGRNWNGEGDQEYRRKAIVLGADAY
jgi:hypothetical protein